MAECIQYDRQYNKGEPPWLIQNVVYFWSSMVSYYTVFYVLARHLRNHRQAESHLWNLQISRSMYSFSKTLLVNYIRVPDEANVITVAAIMCIVAIRLSQRTAVSNLVLQLSEHRYSIP